MSLLRPTARFFAHHAKVSFPETKVSILSNGLKVASETTPSETASIGVFVGVGSRHENVQNNGATHMLGHLAFKGTSNRSAAQLEAEIESLGGNLEIHTTREHTCYKLNVLKSNVPKAVEILSDVLSNSAIQESALEAERATILKEMDKAQVRDLMFDHAHATGFQGGSLSQTVMGTSESVKGLTADALKAFKKDHFVGQKIVLAAAGGVNHEELAKLAEQGLGKLFATGSTSSSKAPYFIGSEIKIRDDEQEDSHIVYSVEGAPASSPDAIPLMVVQYLLGSWDSTLGGGKNLSSKLAQSIAYHGLCSSYTAFSTNYSDTGLFGYYAIGTKRTRLDDLIFQFQNEILRICVNASGPEVERAKAQVKAALQLRLDGPSSIASDIGHQTLSFGERRSLADVLHQVNSVDASSLRSVAYKYLYDKDPAIVAFGPIEGFPDYNRINVNWLRV